LSTAAPAKRQGRRKNDGHGLSRPSGKFAHNLALLPEQVVGIELVQRLRHEEAIPADELVVEPDFAAAMLGP